jgi:hypothetical protein
MMPLEESYGYRIGHSLNGYTIPDRVLNSVEDRPVKVLTIGAGISGILIAYLIQKNCRNVEHVIYEKNGDVRGTWLEVSTGFCYWLSKC